MTASTQHPEQSCARAVRVPLACTLSPEDLLLLVARDEPWPFALTGQWAGGGAIVGSCPTYVAGPDDDPFALLDRQPALVEPSGPAPRADVGGGWFGWLGYGLSGRIEALPRHATRPVPLPDFQLAYYDHVLRRDRRGRWWFEALLTPARERALQRRLARLRRRIARAPSRGTWKPPEPFGLVGGPESHVDAVRACRDRIAAGDLFQANVCLRLEAAWEGNVAELFARAAPDARPAYGAAFPTPWGGIASLSPELFLRRRGRAVRTSPIKGTARRGSDPASALAAMHSLRRSAKDRAEHVMIVDLMRNDLGRVCRYGSVTAPLTPDIEAHAGVWHLVSTVSGALREEVGDAELLRATFPPGSVTGAPKIQAMRFIDTVEPTGREVYTGALGFASPLAGLELSVGIRTFEACGGRLWLGAGGGIVFDSVPAGELEECFVKARPLVAALDSSLELDARTAVTAAGAA